MCFMLIEQIITAAYTGTDCACVTKNTNYLGWEMYYSAVTCLSDSESQASWLQFSLINRKKGQSLQK